MKYTIVDAAGQVIGRASLPHDHIEMNTTDGRTFIIEDAPSPAHRWDGARWVAPSHEQQLVLARAVKHAEIQAARMNSQGVGFHWNGKRFPSDQNTLQRITLAAVAASTAIACNTAFSTRWQLVGGAYLTVDAPQMIEIAQALHKFQEAHEHLHDHYKTIIDAATTAEGISQLGWPPIDELHAAIQGKPS